MNNVANILIQKLIYWDLIEHFLYSQNEEYTEIFKYTAKDHKP